MAEKTLINIEKPQTQTVKAVCALLAWKGRPSNPLPELVEIGKGDSRLMLVLSNKKDCFYVVTAKDCSCPAHNWHPGQRCKHQRRYFAEEQQTVTKPANTGKWPGGMNGPVDPDELKRHVKAASPLYVDTTQDANPSEIAYWSIQEDKALWPAEA